MSINQGIRLDERNGNYQQCSSSYGTANNCAVKAVPARNCTEGCVSNGKGTSGCIQMESRTEPLDTG